MSEELTRINLLDYAGNKEQFYHALRKANIAMPPLTEEVCTVKLMRGIVEGEIWMPHKIDILDLYAYARPTKPQAVQILFERVMDKN